MDARRCFCHSSCVTWHVALALIPSFTPGVANRQGLDVPGCGVRGIRSLCGCSLIATHILRAK
eukprot:7703712-Lingulodinium_polyedra.AAC.1